MQRFFSVLQCSTDFLIHTRTRRHAGGEVSHKIFPSSVGVYGTDGVGKTTFLRKIYDTNKEVSDTFDAVIWVTVAQF